MKKLSLSALLATMILGSCTQVSADESGIGVNFQLTGTSNYHVRGLTQTSGEAAVYGDIILSYGNFYAGVWTSNVDYEETLGVTDADIEIDYYAGYANGYENFAYSATFARYTYPGSDDIQTVDELKFDASYTLDKVTLGAKYEVEIYKEDNSDELEYIEGYASYDFGIASLNASAGSFEDMGDNYEIGLSKAGTFAGQDVEFTLNYVNYDADSTSPFASDNFVYGEVIFTF